jgi:small-conductance mechanosensitive channel
MALIACVACSITTSLLNKSNGIIGALRKRIDVTVTRYIIHTKNLIICIVAFFLYASLVTGLKALIGTMMAGAGFTALIVGFAAKSTISNIIAGLSIAAYRPVSIGDKIDIEGGYCTVEDITLRHTIVRNLQYKRIIIPNARFDEMILMNHTIIDPHILCTVELGVSYDTDIDLVRRLILKECYSCPYRDQAAEEPLMRVISHGNFSIGLRVYLWTQDSENARSAKFWLLENLKKRFDKEGVEIPFPYQTLVYKKDLEENIWK